MSDLMFSFMNRLSIKPISSRKSLSHPKCDLSSFRLDQSVSSPSVALQKATSSLRSALKDAYTRLSLHFSLRYKAL